MVKSVGCHSFPWSLLTAGFFFEFVNQEKIVMYKISQAAIEQALYCDGVYIVWKSTIFSDKTVFLVFRIDCSCMEIILVSHWQVIKTATFWTKYCGIIFDYAWLLGREGEARRLFPTERQTVLTQSGIRRVTWDQTLGNLQRIHELKRATLTECARQDVGGANRYNFIILHTVQPMLMELKTEDDFMSRDKPLVGPTGPWGTCVPPPESNSVIFVKTLEHVDQIIVRCPRIRG